MHIDYIVNFVHFFKGVPRAPSDEPNGQKYSSTYYGILKLRNSINCLHKTMNRALVKLKHMKKYLKMHLQTKRGPVEMAQQTLVHSFKTS